MSKGSKSLSTVKNICSRYGPDEDTCRECAKEYNCKDLEDCCLYDCFFCDDREMCDGRGIKSDKFKKEEREL